MITFIKNIKLKYIFIFFIFLTLFSLLAINLYTLSRIKTLEEKKLIAQPASELAFEKLPNGCPSDFPLKSARGCYKITPAPNDKYKNCHTYTTGQRICIPQPKRPTPTPRQNPREITNELYEKQLLEKIEYRVSLSEQDKTAVDRILSVLPTGEQSGTVYQSANINILYLYAPDLILVETLTTDLAKAKQEAGTWLKQQGMSQKGICDYPVEFFPNSKIIEELRKLKLSFNPLAEGC